MTLAANQWSDVTFSASTGSFQFYVNGAPVATTYNWYQGSTAPQMVQNGQTSYLTVGGYPDSDLQNTSFAEFQLFGSSLTASQVNQLYLGTVGVLPAASGVQIGSAGVLDLAGFNQTVASLSDITLGSGGLVTNSVGGPVTLTLAPLPGAATFSGVIEDGSGPGALTSLTVNGAGTQVLAGSNTYTGPTTILTGTLQIGSGGATGSIDSSSGVVDNGILAFSRSDTVEFLHYPSEAAAA